MTTSVQRLKYGVMNVLMALERLENKHPASFMSANSQSRGRQIFGALECLAIGEVCRDVCYWRM